MPRCDMLFVAGSRRLEPLQAMPTNPRSTPQPLQDETGFRNPPQWFHEAARWLFSRREAKKQAVIRLLDRLAAPVAPKKPLA